MRRRILFSGLTLAVLLLVAGPASAARIIVTIDGLHNAQGSIFVGLYSNPREFLNGNLCDKFIKVRASTGPVTVAFDNLRPGTYAVGAYHDENGNDHLDTNFLGLPTEGYALSNNVRAVLSRPEFHQAAFTVGNGDRPVGLHIQY